jgi:hypothetical protein
MIVISLEGAMARGGGDGVHDPWRGLLHAELRGVWIAALTGKPYEKAGKAETS